MLDREDWAGGDVAMKKPAAKELRLLKREAEPEPAPPPTPESPMDAAESRWDPWLLALARMEALEGAPRLN
jgi:hypothetical protein